MDRVIVVLAGGLGTRVREVTGGLIPKALIPIEGIPFLEHKLRSLEEMGACKIVLLVGELSALVEEFVNTRKHSYSSIQVITDGRHLLGTGGSVAAALGFLPNNFWLTYGDSLVSTDLDDVEKKCTRLGYRNSMTVLRYSPGLENPNIAIEKQRVVKYEKGTKSEQLTHLDYGLLYLEAHWFRTPELGPIFDLSVPIRRIVETQSMHAYEVSNRYWEIGSLNGIRETEAFLQRNKTGQ
jgi:NDP-sugar pyrophosphorylase family protein